MLTSQLNVWRKRVPPMNKFATCVGYVMIGAACFSVVGIILAIIFASNAGNSPNTQTRNERATNEAAFVAANATVKAKATATALAGPTEFPTDFVYPTAGLRPTDTVTPASTPVPTMTALPLPTATGASTAMPLPTATDAVTATPLPTATSVPTLTPVPTEAVAPTAASVDGLGRDAYLKGLREFFVTFYQSSQVLSKLAEDPQPFSAEWKVAIVLPAASLRVAYQDLQGLTPPPRFIDFHADFVRVYGKCDSSLDYMISGLDSYDKSVLDQGVELMMSCNAEAKPLLAEFEKLMN